MPQDGNTVRRSRPIGRLVLAVLVIGVIVAAVAYMLLAGSERIYFADELAEAPPPARVLSELAPGETALAAVLKRDAFGEIDEFVLTDRRLLRIRGQDRWSFPLARWNGYGASRADGRTDIKLSTIDDHNIYIAVETSPAVRRLMEVIEEAFETRPDRDEATPESEIPGPRQLGPFEHPDMGYVIWLFPLVLGLLGLLILTVALRSWRNARHRVRHHRRAAGTVVDHVSDDHTDDDGHSRTVYHPVVEFTASNGRQVTFKSALATGRKKPLGHTLKVLYDPERPENARIHAFGPLYFLPLVAGILGLAALAWAASLVWLILSEL